MRTAKTETRRRIGFWLASGLLSLCLLFVIGDTFIPTNHGESPEGPLTNPSLQGHSSDPDSTESVPPRRSTIEARSAPSEGPLSSFGGDQERARRLLASPRTHLIEARVGRLWPRFDSISVEVLRAWQDPGTGSLGDVAFLDEERLTEQSLPKIDEVPPRDRLIYSMLHEFYVHRARAVDGVSSLHAGDWIQLEYHKYDAVAEREGGQGLPPLHSWKQGQLRRLVVRRFDMVPGMSYRYRVLMCSEVLDG